MNDNEQTIQLDLSSLQTQASCLERYAIKGLIGQGGMGMVFCGFDQELGRDVAIKVLLFDGSRESESQERFTREAKALAILDHAYIVQIFSAGINESGNPYTVMEYLEGESLSQRLERGPLNAEEFFELISHVVQGLKHAHENNIVHRDLKPTNIMLCKSTDGSRICKLIDFGIARIDMSPERAGKTLTRTNAILGSPIYMSPEQCRGERGDFLSDIYSLGIIMYECIAGKPPFRGDTAFETMYKHMSETCSRLDQTTKSVPSKELSDLIQRCLEKNPAARPQTLSEIENELNRIFSKDMSKIDLFSQRKSFKANKIAFGVCLGVFPLVLAVAGTAIYFAGHSSSCSVVTTEQEKLANRINRMKSRFSVAPDSALSIKDPSLRERHILGLFELGWAQLQSDKRSDLLDAEKTFSAALAFCKAFPAELGGRRAACFTYRARAKYLLGQIESANSDFDEALSLASPKARPDILLERCALRISSSNFSGASQDFARVTEAYHSRTNDLDRLEFFMPALDKGGVLRCRLFDKIGFEICKLKAHNASDAIEIVSLADQVVPVLIEIKHTGEAKDIMKFALPLLDKIPGNESLKKQTREIAKAAANS